MGLPIKLFKFGDEARLAIKKGMQTVADVVLRTMGAKGRYTLYQYSYRNSAATKDGYISAKQIILEDPFEDKGAFHMLEAMFKTTQKSGDGSTLTCLLTYEFFNKACRAITAGANPVLIKKGLDMACNELVRFITDKAKPVTGAMLLHVANISLNGDNEIALLIYEAMQKVGTEGTVTCRDGRERNHSLEVISGMTMPQGYENPFFINSYSNRSWTAYNPFVFCFEGEIHSGREIAGIVNQVLETDRPMLFVCHEIDIAPLKDIMATKKVSQLDCCLITTPGQNIDNNRSDILQDIAAFTGAKVFSEFALPAKTATLKDLGSAEQIIIKDEETVIVKGTGSREAIQGRIQLIEEDLKSTDDDVKKERLLVRKARLLSGVAILRIGAVTTTEMSEKKDRVEDALQAVQAAVKKGIVPGGGAAFLDFEQPFSTSLEIEDIRYGVDIVMGCLRSPMRQILKNAGIDDTESIITKCHKTGQGFDVDQMKYCDMAENGIIDPAYVLTTAIENACSIVGTLLLTESIIVTKPEIQKAAKE